MCTSHVTSNIQNPSWWKVGGCLRKAGFPTFLEWRFLVCEIPPFFLTHGTAQQTLIQGRSEWVRFDSSVSDAISLLGSTSSGLILERWGSSNECSWCGILSSSSLEFLSLAYSPHIRWNWDLAYNQTRGLMKKASHFVFNNVDSRRGSVVHQEGCLQTNYTPSLNTTMEQLWLATWIWPWKKIF